MRATNRRRCGEAIRSQRGRQHNCPDQATPSTDHAEGRSALSNGMPATNGCVENRLRARYRCLANDRHERGPAQGHGNVWSIGDGAAAADRRPAPAVARPGRRESRPSALGKGDDATRSLAALGHGAATTTKYSGRLISGLHRRDQRAAATTTSSTACFARRRADRRRRSQRGEAPISQLTAGERSSCPLRSGGAYELLKTATEIFLLLECGGCHPAHDVIRISILTRNGASSRVPGKQITDRLRVYLGSGTAAVHRPCPANRLSRATCSPTSLFCAVLTARVECTCLIELIWSYWHEEGMLAQTLNAISRRFQNMRSPGDRDPAGASRDRSAAAAQQPALGLYPGRAEPADGQAARLRIRSSLRPDDLRQGSAAAAAGGQPLEVPGGFHHLLHR